MGSIPAGVRERIVEIGRIAGLGVSRETLLALETHVTLLERWQPVQNLVAPATLPDAWKRHVLDSAQALPLVSGASRLCDLGSGAGFPGLVLAILLSGRPGTSVHLVESNQRKAAFLRQVAQATGAPAVVEPVRIETAAAVPERRFDVVTARALAPLDRLLSLAAPLLSGETVAILHKGGGYREEIDAAVHHFRFDLVIHDSITDPDGRLLEIRNVRPRAGGTRPGG